MPHSFPTRRYADRIFAPPDVSVIAPTLERPWDRLALPDILAVGVGGGRQRREGGARQIGRHDRPGIAIEIILGIISRQISEEHTSELQSLMRISYAVFCLKKKKTQKDKT